MWSVFRSNPLEVLCLPSLTTCSDDGKPHMLVKALDQSYKNHVGSAVIRASGEAEYPPTSGHVCATVLHSRPERVKDRRKLGTGLMALNRQNLSRYTLTLEID